MKYEMIKTSFTNDLWIIVICIIPVVIGIFLFILMSSSKTYKLEIINDELSVKSIFYNTRIKITQLDIEKMKYINMDNENIKFNYKLNGIGLPGLQIGWFSGNGKKYKLYLTDTKKVLLIPTKLNYDILFSTENGLEIINEIKIKYLKD